MKTEKRFPFTKTRLESLPIPKEGRVSYYDEKVACLSLRISHKGDKSFYVYKSVDGKPNRYRLGGFPEITIEQARTLANDYMAELAKGNNPQQARKQRRSETTIAELITYWVENHAKKHKKTWKEDDRLFKKFVAKWNSRRLSDVTRNDVSALHSGIGEKNGKYQANRLLALIRAAFNLAKRELGFKGENPAEDIKPFKEESRDRFLQPQEIPLFFNALDADEPLFRDFFKVAIFTGARRSKVQQMRWDEIQGETWRIPDNKNGENILIPLSPETQAILQERKKGSKSPYVFPSYGKQGHLIEPKAAWKRICNRAGLSNLRMHDLRRTLGSYLAAQGASLPIIGKMLGHKPGSSATSVYARLNLEPIQTSLNQATSTLSQLASKKAENEKPSDESTE